MTTIRNIDALMLVDEAVRVALERARVDCFCDLDGSAIARAVMLGLEDRYVLLERDRLLVRVSDD